jgi:hypothetical protein
LDNRYARHFAEPHISAAQHSLARRISLGAEVLGKRRIYLDQKFWIFCRDAHLGKPNKPSHDLIWRALCSLVDTGRVVCPVAYPVLIETFKQGDAQRRKATATVIDRLSCRVALQPFPELVRIELYHLFRKHAKGKSAVYPLKRLVWTYAGWIAGEMIADNPVFDDATNNALQKGMFDTLAAAPFSSIIDATSGKPSPPLEDTEQHYAKLNADTTQHQDEVTSFDTVFMSEVAGTLDTIKPDIAGMLRHHYEEETKQVPPPPGSSEETESVRLMSNLIYHAYRLKKWTVEFPFLHVGAGIHAAVRYRRQPYKRGDHWDHLHAHPALAYCDAFLTEKNLGNLLCTPPLNYDSAYGCRVLWNDDDVLAYLQSIDQGSSAASA